MSRGLGCPRFYMIRCRCIVALLQLLTFRPLRHTKKVLQLSLPLNTYFGKSSWLCCCWEEKLLNLLMVSKVSGAQKVPKVSLYIRKGQKGSPNS